MTASEWAELLEAGWAAVRARDEHLALALRAMADKAGEIAVRARARDALALFRDDRPAGPSGRAALADEAAERSGA